MSTTESSQNAGGRYRAICYTWHKADFDCLKPIPPWVDYNSVSLEEGINVKDQRDNNPHLQGYAEFCRPIEFKRIKEWLHRTGRGSAHIEKRKGTQAEANWYSQKPTEMDHTARYANYHIAGPEVVGVMKVQGKRMDLEPVIKACGQKRKLREIAIENPDVYIKFHRGIEKYHALNAEAPRRDDIKVLVLYGEPRSGKSRVADALYPDAYRYTDTYEGWFDNYNEQKVVIMDEFEGRTRFNVVKQLLDRYPFKMPTKGGFVNVHATTFILTTNLDPYKIYDGYPAWLGRLHDYGTCVFFKKGDGSGGLVLPPTSVSSVLRNSESGIFPEMVFPFYVTKLIIEYLM